MKVRALQLNFLWLSIVLFFSCLPSAFAQTRVSVIDEKGLPLVGVYVNYGDESITTDLNGQFEFQSSPSKELSFRFEYLAYQDLQLTEQELIDAGYTVRMYPDNEILEEIIITGRTASREEDLINSVRRIKAESIYRSAAQNTADAIEANGAAYVQRSQMGGGSPVVRGFEANKLLLVVDGVRMNNAIYRNGHLHNAISIDPSILDQMDVLFGAGSLLYGSDALGGVIHFKTRSPELNFAEAKKSKQVLDSYIRYNSANEEKRIHASYNYGNKKWAVLSSVSLVEFGDLRSGNNRSAEYPDFGKRTEYVSTDDQGNDTVLENEDPSIQIGTAYKQLDLMQKFLFQHNNNSKSELNIQFSTTSDVPRYDNLNEYRNGQLRYAEWEYGPQQRFLASHQLSLSRSHKLFDELILISSYQNIREERKTRTLNSNVRELQLEKLHVAGLTLDLKKLIAGSHSLNYGLDMHYNDVASEAQSITDPYSSNPVVTQDILSRYPSGGNSLFNVGAYIQHKWTSNNDQLSIINGIRASYQRVDLNYRRDDAFEWPEYYYAGIRNENEAVVTASAVNYKNGNWNIKLSSGTSFRAPNVDDLAKIRINNNEITIPNPELKAERAWSSEIDLSYRIKKTQLSFSAYTTSLKNAIIRRNAQLPDGSDYYVVQGDSLLVTANTNALSARINGISMQLDWQIIPELKLNSIVNFQSGKATDETGESSPLGHIAPTFGAVRLQYQKNRLGVGFNCRFNAWKDIEDFGGSVDNPELATIDGSPAFIVLGLSADYQLSESWSINLGLQNLSDRHYRAFSSGVSGAGRHVFLSVKYHWQNS